MTERMDESWRLLAKEDALKLRARMIQTIRRFFLERDFLEIETPCRIPAPAPEAHIEAVASSEWFLHTSPELCMKRLLAAGYPKIFQICRCFRGGERGDCHLPEFTLLEWYRRGADYLALMDDCEALIGAAAGELGFAEGIPRREGPIGLLPPWERLTVREAFARHAPLSASEALSSDRFEEIMACCIEPRLGVERPVFLYEYPVVLGALARVKEGDPEVAERFELYIGGMEIANAFSELTDAGEQRRRFEAARRERLERGGAVYPMPEPFLDDLPRMCPCAGIALGVDRLAMLLAGKDRIDDVVAFTPEFL